MTVRSSSSRAASATGRSKRRVSASPTSAVRGCVRASTTAARALPMASEASRLPPTVGRPPETAQNGANFRQPTYALWEPYTLRILPPRDVDVERITRETQPERSKAAARAFGAGELLPHCPKIIGSRARKGELAVPVSSYATNRRSGRDSTTRRRRGHRRQKGRMSMHPDRSSAAEYDALLLALLT